MVNSLLKKGVTYSEINELDPKDVNYEATIYEVNIFGKNKYIALGEQKLDKQREHRIIYFPIYLIVKDKVVAQLGVYEVMDTSVLQITDEDNDIDLNKLSNPLFFSFAKAAINKLTKTKKQTLKIVDDESEQEEIPAIPTTDDESEDDEDAISLEDEETDYDEEGEEGEEGEETDYDDPFGKDDEADENWIQTFLKDKSYGLVDNEGGGDCLFAVIRDGLKTIGRMVTVKEMREMLAAEVTEDMYTNLMEIYRSITGEIDTGKSARKQNEIEQSEYLQELIKTTQQGGKQKLIGNIKKLEGGAQQLEGKLSDNQELLEEFAYLKDVKSVEDLRDKIKTNEFWADTWAISTLERLLMIKLVLLSQKSYYDADIGNIIQCGHLNDDILEKAGEFNPSHYILTEYGDRHYTLRHYKLVTKNGIGAFSFNELSKIIVDQIIAKCLERDAGPYYLIPEFKQYKLKGSIEEHLSPSISRELTPSVKSSSISRELTPSVKPSSISRELTPSVKPSSISRGLTPSVKPSGISTAGIQFKTKPPSTPSAKLATSSIIPPTTPPVGPPFKVNPPPTPSISGIQFKTKPPTLSG